MIRVVDRDRWRASCLLGVASGRRRPGRRFLQGQADPLRRAHHGRRRLRPVHAADRPLHGQVHPRQSDDRGRQHAGRRRHHRCELHGAGRAARRHRDRHRQPGTRRRPGARHRRRSSRPICGSSTGSPTSSTRTSCWWCGTPRRPRRSRTPRSASPRSAPPARARPRCSIRRSTTTCSAPNSRSCSAIRAASIIDLAMERGEVEGRGTNPYSGWMASKPTWIPEKKIIPLIQAGIEKEPALPDVPLIVDQPVRAEDKPLLQFMAQVVDGRTTARHHAGRSRRPGGGVAGGVRGHHPAIRSSSPPPRRRTWRSGRRPPRC